MANAGMVSPWLRHVLEGLVVTFAQLVLPGLERYPHVVSGGGKLLVSGYIELV